MGRRDKKKQASALSHTLIAEGTVIKGDITFSGGLHIQGSVLGNIRSDHESSQLIIGETGVVEGEVKVPRVIVNGRVVGNVHSSEHLELAEKAEIEGSVFYSVIEMLMGACVNGKLVRHEELRNLPAPEMSHESYDEDADDVEVGNA